MARVIQDGELRSWEVYASTGRYGLAQSARILFHCLSDPTLRAVMVEMDGDKAVAERTVRTASAEELLEMLGTGAPVS